MLGKYREENAVEPLVCKTPWWKDPISWKKLILSNYSEKKTKHRNLSPVEKTEQRTKGPSKRKTKVVRESCNTQRTTTD